MTARELHYPSASVAFSTLYIFGAGGFGREVAWLVEQSLGAAVRTQFVVDKSAYLDGSINGLDVRLLKDVEVTQKARFVVAIGDPAVRRLATAACLAAGHLPATLVHPRVEMSRWVCLGEGTIICAGCIITTNVAIAPHVHVNLGCTIGHDVVIREYTTLAPGVRVSGNVHIGQGVFVGTGASFIAGTADDPLIIGDGAVIAAGACVTRSVEPGALVAGVPALRKR